jgi:hypothetical protein
MNTLKKWLAGAGLAMAVSTSASAVTVTNDVSLWQFGAGDWTETTTYGANFSTISSFDPVGGGTITLGAPAEVRQIGAGWATWCCGYTGQVLYDAGATSVTWSFSSGDFDGFGVYAEPNPFAEYSMTLTLLDGTTLTQDVHGDHGARFFGFLGGGVTQMTVSIAGATDFAMGDVFVSHIPEPETYAMLLAGLALMGFVARRRRMSVATA